MFPLDGRSLEVNFFTKKKKKSMLVYVYQGKSTMNSFCSMNFFSYKIVLMPNIVCFEYCTRGIYLQSGTYVVRAS